MMNYRERIAFNRSRLDPVSGDQMEIRILRERVTELEVQLARYVPDPTVWGDVREEAEREWAHLLVAVDRGDRDVMLGVEGVVALRAIGGWNAVAYCGDEVDLERRRQEFLAAFGVTRRERARAALPTGGEADG